jgi:hypothetical protein
MMKGLPDTGSHPAKMGIEINYCEGLPREKYYVVCV